ncbi:hypothetical protein GPX89_19800 [Nocardia sp. ET3-3]|uniref:Uncharacterized protein n=1 Tax=Nocardia terrae TaxID=2675851 RepID=A0A7K1UZ83_9NOCA|nr:hypothetical protein [Nocardia terrae]MVU79479.1 hypothetical protein [Nocardia terrae]
MHDNTNEQILPIPSDLYAEIGQIEERIYELRRDVRRLRNRYAELRQSPQSLRVDNLGQAIEPREAVEAAYQALDSAEFNLDDTSESLGWAHRAGSRLSLTDAAAEHREQQLAQQHRIERTR